MHGGALDRMTASAENSATLLALITETALFGPFWRQAKQTKTVAEFLSGFFITVPPAIFITCSRVDW